MAIIAAQQALADSGLMGVLTSQKEIRSRVGVIIGTTFGESQILERANELLVMGQNSGDELDSRGRLDQYRPNSLSVNIGKQFGLAGPNYVVPTACAAGNYAISLGTSLIKSGKADAVLVGGSDPFSKVAFSGFSRLGVMAENRCQPFDKNRKGMLVGEGAGVLILEERNSALARGAKLYAEVLGYGLSCDASHMTIPRAEGMISAIEHSLRNAGLVPQDVDYVSAHGTGTLANDKMESQAIRTVFYNRGNSVPVSSIKSMMGHLMGAASAVEAIACVLAIKHGEIPPTANYETPDPECGIDCVPNLARKKDLRIVLNNAFAFGGINACLVIGKG